MTLTPTTPETANFLDPGIRRAMIENTLSRYGWAYDLGELDKVGDCFTVDAEVHFPTGIRQGRAAIQAQLTEQRAKYTQGRRPWHLITDVWIEEETRIRASVRSRFSFGVMMSGQHTALTVFGGYEDLFVLDEDNWRISRRRMTRAENP